MSYSINPAYTKTFNTRDANQNITVHRMMVVQATPLGDAATLFLDGLPIVEVSGEAVARLQAVVDAVVAIHT